MPLEEYKKTKSFNGKDNFREDKITAEESQFVRENINPETVKAINDLYKIITGRYLSIAGTIMLLLLV